MFRSGASDMRHLQLSPFQVRDAMLVVPYRTEQKPDSEDHELLHDVGDRLDELVAARLLRRSALVAPVDLTRLALEVIPEALQLPQPLLVVGLLRRPGIEGPMAPALHSESPVLEQV